MPRLRRYRKIVERAAPVSGNQRGLANQVALDIVEPQCAEPNVAQAGQESDPGSEGIAADERAMHGHRLRRVFDPTGNAQAAVRAQRMIGVEVRQAAAADVLRIPLNDFIEQAHAAAMGNVAFDPAAI
jgi:hypothetical protein